MPPVAATAIRVRIVATAYTAAHEVTIPLTNIVGWMATPQGGAMLENAALTEGELREDLKTAIILLNEIPHASRRLKLRTDSALWVTYAVETPEEINSQVGL